MNVVPLAQIIQRTADQLAQRYDVDAGLAAVVGEVQGAERPGEAVEKATTRLRERSRALDAAGDELEELQTRVRYLADRLRFTAEGWPERRADLAALLTDAPTLGVASWLDDWFAAASACRGDALARLLAMQNLPPELALLRERCTLAAHALEKLDWAVTDPVLSAGATGLQIGERVLPEDHGVRAELQLLRVRLALNDGFQDAADDALRAAEESAPSASIRALRARWHRQGHDEDAAAHALANARALDPGNLDVNAELIAQTNSPQRAEIALESARMAIDKLPVLADIESVLGRLVTAPAELWVAAAERAFAERDLNVHALAVARAESLARPGDIALRATIAESAATGLETRGGSPQELVDAHRRAGIRAVQAGQAERAVPHFRRVLELQPDNGDATLRLADCHVTLVDGLPLATARGTLQSALDSILAVHARDGVNGNTSWSYLSEAAARRRLAAGVALETNDHAWRAFLAVCRSIVHQYDSATCWGDLSAAAQELSLYWVAIAASEQAFALDPQDNVAVLIQALANADEIEAALGWLGEPEDDWDQAVRGYLLGRAGEPWQAVAALRAATLDPSWAWAVESLIRALLVTDRYDEAVKEAHEQRERWADRLDEVNGVWTSAWSSVVVGDLSRAQTLADALDGRDDEGQSHEITGMIRLLEGDGEGGCAALRAKIAATRVTGEIDAWPTLFVQPLRVLASHRGRPLPVLVELDEALEARRAELLSAREDFLKELEDAPVRGVDPEVVSLARTLGSALLLAARGKLDAALTILESGADERPEHPDVVSLRASIQGRRDTVAPTSDGADPGPKAEGESDAQETDGIAALLPPSWFEGHPDPLHDHELFLRYLPELRMRADWVVPSINIRAVNGLEPDRFQILVGDDVVDEGRVAPGFAYGTSEALTLVGVDLAVVEEDEALALQRVPTDALATLEPLAGLLTMPAIEVVARRIGKVADEHAGRLGGPTPHLNWRHFFNTAVTLVLDAVGASGRDTRE